MLSVEVASRLASAWKTAAPSPAGTDADADAGRALAIAMTRQTAEAVAPQIDALSLYVVELRSADAFDITPAEAYRHPLLTDWTAATFADAMGDCLCAGRLAFNLAPNAPVYDCMELIEEDGEIRQARATLVFETQYGTLRATFRYGRPLVASFGHISAVNSDAVFRVGAAIRVGLYLPDVTSSAGAAAPGPAVH